MVRTVRTPEGMSSWPDYPLGGEREYPELPSLKKKDKAKQQSLQKKKHSVPPPVQSIDGGEELPEAPDI